MSAHMNVCVLSFIVSARTGCQFQNAAVKSNLILELRGKSPAIIFNDADLNKAATGTQRSIQWNSG